VAAADTPVHKSALGVHQIKLFVKSRPRIGYGGGVTEHAARAMHRSQVAVGYDRWTLVVDANLRAHSFILEVRKIAP
jgi:hypothetical protein